MNGSPIMRKIARTALAIVLSASVPGVTPQPAAMAREPAVVVEMNNQLQFVPEKVTIIAGQSVKWVNNSVLVHTVTTDPSWAATPDSVKLPDGAETFHSGNMDPNDIFIHTFETPGTYKYFCVPHEGANMIGLVEVKSR